MLERVRLPGLGARKPVQLSGGQRQRVALARAIVNNPTVLLLDEPLGALDLKLRQEMQVFLKELQRELGITFVYVTHDQEEALTMSDRLAVFNEGQIEQIGTPADVYEHPETEFVAGFVGVSNVLERDGKRFTIRPEKIHMSETGTGEPGVVRDVVYVGMVTRYIVDLDTRRRARRRPAEPRDLVAAGARGPRQSGSASRGGRSTRTRSSRRETTSEKDSQGSRPRRRVRGRAVRAGGRRQHEHRPADVGREGRGTAEPHRVGGLHASTQWVKPFQKATGCKVNAKYAGSSDEMVTLMRRAAARSTTASPRPATRASA